MIRKLVKEDVSRVAEIHTFGKRCAYKDFLSNAVLFKKECVASSINGWNEWIERSDDIEHYVFEEDGIIKGFLSFATWVETDMPDALELLGLYVEPLMKKQGIGSKLLAFFEKRVKDHGYNKAYLWTYEKNIESNSFYKAKGYRQDSKRTMHNASEVRYVKSLTV